MLLRLTRFGWIELLEQKTQSLNRSSTIYLPCEEILDSCLWLMKNKNKKLELPPEISKKKKKEKRNT